MPSWVRRRSFGPSVLAVVIAATVLPSVGAGWAVEQKRVLVLYSTRRDAQISVVGDRELPRLLGAGLKDGLDYYSEYIDVARFPEPDYQAAFRDFIREKYQGQSFDLVIAIKDTAVEFATLYRRDLFPDAPVVFAANRAATVRPATNATGVLAPLDLSRTLTLAAALQPDLRQVFVVSGAAEPDRGYERLARTQLQPFEKRFAITYLSGLPAADLESRLAALPERSAVYFLLVYRDGAGENFHPLNYLDRVTRIANAPTYCWVSSSMDHGIVGGSLQSQDVETRTVAGLALRVLNGEAADGIPVTTPDVHVNEVDWRQLRRWGLSEANLPAGTLVHFREPSTWDRYRVYIISALVLTVSQSALIAGLLVQRRRRRKAERDVLRNQAELRASYERIRDLGGRLLTAQEAERARIARELHDDVSQQVALLEMDLEQLEGAAGGPAEELAGDALGRARNIGRSLHDLSHRLHPAKLRLIGLVSALHGLQRELSQSPIRISITHDHVPAVIGPDVTLCLFRVVQEALQNAIKYSGAQQVSVHLAGRADGLSLTITDDGRGFDVTAAFGKGLGLVSMQERLEAVGGALQIRSAPGAGTMFDISVPLPQLRADSA